MGAGTQLLQRASQEVINENLNDFGNPENGGWGRNEVEDGWRNSERMIIIIFSFIFFITNSVSYVHEKDWQLNSIYG